jgi:opacity protein-like surface antigen
MMKRLLAVSVAVCALMLAAAESAVAAETFGARLRGNEETPVPISTAGQGFFVGTLNTAGTQLDYSVVYFGITNTVAQSHIHFGPPAISGGIVLFLCTNLAPPAAVPLPPPCPNGVGLNIVSGSLTAADVIAVSGQGIASGAFADVIAAMRAGVSYVNVHTNVFPGGEIRGVVTR